MHAYLPWVQVVHVHMPFIRRASPGPAARPRAVHRSLSLPKGRGAHHRSRSLSKGRFPASPNRRGDKPSRAYAQPGTTAARVADTPHPGIPTRRGDEPSRACAHNVDSSPDGPHEGLSTGVAGSPVRLAFAPEPGEMCATNPAIWTYAELRRSGLSRRRLTAMTDASRIVSVRRGVYAGGACGPRATAAKHGGGLACVSAARHIGLWVLDESDAVHVWLGRRRHRHPHEGCRCVEHRDGMGAAFGAPSVPRVLRQILRCRGLEEFFVVLESALAQRRITDAGMDWLRGSTNDAAREAMDFARSDAGSGLESLVRWRLRSKGLSVRTQVGIVSVGRVDLVIGERLIVEVDGDGNHSAPEHRHRDLVRDAHAAIWGYVSLRFDYAMVVHDWETVELAILAHVDRGLHLAR